MVRGRKRMTMANGTLTPEKMQKFKGKLSHTSPASYTKITNYFNAQLPLNNIQLSEIICIDSTNVNDRFHDSDIGDADRKVLLDTNCRFDDVSIKQYSAEHPEPMKTEKCVPESPTTALSCMTLNSPKRNIKARRRLVAVNDNPSIISKSDTTKLVQQSSGKQLTLTEFFPIRRSVRKTSNKVLEEKRRNIEEAVLSMREDGLEVKIFEGKGRGVVASKSFKKGEFVVEYAGELISMEEAQKREIMYASDENIGCYMYYFKCGDNQYCIDATAESGRLGRLLNHSRNGNLCTKTIVVQGAPHLILLAKQDINAGTELTYDYGDRSRASLQYHPWLAL